MMFSGPHAASPPKNTPACVECIVVLSTTGMLLLVEVDADVALDPGERVLLADGENDVVARKDDGVDDFALLLAALLEPAQAVELEPDELSVLEDEPLRRVVLDDLDAFLFSIL